MALRALKTFGPVAVAGIIASTAIRVVDHSNATASLSIPAGNLAPAHFTMLGSNPTIRSIDSLTGSRNHIFGRPGQPRLPMSYPPGLAAYRYGDFLDGQNPWRDLTIGQPDYVSFDVGVLISLALFITYLLKKFFHDSPELVILLDILSFVQSVFSGTLDGPSGDFSADMILFLLLGAGVHLCRRILAGAVRGPGSFEDRDEFVGAIGSAAPAFLRAAFCDMSWWFLAAWGAASVICNDGPRSSIVLPRRLADWRIAFIAALWLVVGAGYLRISLTTAKIVGSYDDWALKLDRRLHTAEIAISMLFDDVDGMAERWANEGATGGGGGNDVRAAGGDGRDGGDGVDGIDGVGGDGDDGNVDRDPEGNDTE